MTESKCNHQCSSNCRREGCGCLCGEWHCPADEPCRYTDPNEAPCPNHPKGIDIMEVMKPEFTENNLDTLVDKIIWDK